MLKRIVKNNENVQATPQNGNVGTRKKNKRIRRRNAITILIA